MLGRRLVLPLGLLALALPAAADTSLWVAATPDLPGTVADTARLRDRFPDALVLDDGASAQALAAAGVRVHGPFVADDPDHVFLLRARGDGAPAPGAADALAAAGVTVLWTDGGDWLVTAPDGLPDVLPGRLAGKRLSSVPLAGRTMPSADLPLATSFDPLIDTLVAQVDSARYFPWIRRLAGAEPVMVGGAPMTFTTRSTYTSQCRSAEQYVLERFHAMGFTDVAFDPFLVGSTTARNVVATLPGVTTPERIYVVGGHLDSTSPNASTDAPGGNDNASGTAAVLAIADVLKDYTFDSTIQFVAFTGEEQGLYGSQHFVTKAVANGDDIRGAVTCDMIAWYGANYRIDIEGESFAASFMQVMNDACAAYTGLATYVTYFAWGSDHVPFLDQGIPAFLAIESDYGSYPCYHRTCDTADRNDAAFGVEVTRACLAVTAHVAGIHAGGTGVPATGSGAAALSLRPNPFREETVLEYALDRSGPVRVGVYDVGGRLLRTLVDAPRPAGTHRVAWDGRSAGTPVPAGIYFLRVESAGAATGTRAVRLP